MAPRKQTYEERLKRLFNITTGPWITRNAIILRFGPDYREALAELERLLNVGTVIRQGYRGSRGPMSWTYKWMGTTEI